MKCSNCGFENEQDFSFCPSCGAQTQPTIIPQNSAAGTILQALKDPLFLVICILMSVSCLLSLAADSTPLIEILLTVFLWLTYAQSLKGTADAKHLRCVSGTVYANYVINYVLAGLLLLLGVIFAAFFGALASDTEFLDTLLSGFADTETLANVTAILASFSGGVFLFIFALAAALIVVINIFSLRYIHSFAQSVYRSIETGVLALRSAIAAQIWLYVFSAFSGVGALTALFNGQLLTALNNGATCAMNIIASILIKKYLLTEE